VSEPRLPAFVRRETVGGIILLAATVIALVWSNSPASSGYFALRDLRVGPDILHLRLSLGSWAADGLLAIFFFVAGLELKHEFVAGSLSRFSRAVVPVSAAVGGVVVPAVIFTIVNASSGGEALGGEALRGWAIPTATDIAFALAVLAIVSSHLPPALRTFLLTLAVVDDLLAIGIIAFVYTDDLAPLYLLAAVVPLVLFGLLVQRGITAWYLLFPLAAVTWVLVHASGVHATVAGILLAFAVPVVRRKRGETAGRGLALRFEHTVRPLSNGIAVPIFAFFSAGVAIGGAQGFGRAFADPVAIGIVVALVLGKTIGVFATTWLVSTFSPASKSESLAWADVFGLALLTGVGFTVSLLVSDLAYGVGTPHDDHAKVAILVGSLTAAVLGSVVLAARNRHYRRTTLVE
jgi:NhaA family Na+:H+ antiporter